MLAHMVIIIPYAVVLSMVALSQLYRRMDMPAQSTGTTRVFSVNLPNIRFGMIGVFFLCLLLSRDEIGVTLFVTSVDTTTVPRRMWLGLRDNVDPSIPVLSVQLIGVVTALVPARAIVAALRARQAH